MGRRPQNKIKAYILQNWRARETEKTVGGQRQNGEETSNVVVFPALLRSTATPAEQIDDPLQVALPQSSSRLRRAFKFLKQGIGALSWRLQHLFRVG